MSPFSLITRAIVEALNREGTSLFEEPAEQPVERQPDWPDRPVYLAAGQSSAQKPGAGLPDAEKPDKEDRRGPLCSDCGGPNTSDQTCCMYCRWGEK